MIFSSVTFLFYFFPIMIFIYWIAPNQWKNIVLLLGSLIFYGWGEPIFLLLLLFSTLVDFTLGNLIGSAHRMQKPKRARTFMIASVFTNLSLLVFFKYGNLLLGSLFTLINKESPFLSIALPLGISFYTFQTMSYSIDVYRQKVAPQKNFVDFAAYVTMFPQLIAGPIVRYESIYVQLKSRVSHYDDGIRYFILGLAQKVILANNLGLIWEEIKLKEIASLPTLTAWIGILTFGLQIYFDFCGYSNMAIGLGKMFGFHFPPNFNYPYTAKSITDFWRRWHISLSSWFKEYVYIPLGGNRKGSFMQIRNIIIVWLLTGIWHGAAWNFLFWGLYFGVLLLIEKFFLNTLLKKLPSWIQHVYTLFYVAIGWVLFAFEETDAIFTYLKVLFVSDDFIGDSAMFYITNNWVLLLIAVLCCTNFVPHLKQYVLNVLKQVCKEDTRKTLIGMCKFLLSLGMLLCFLISIAYIVDNSYNPFLYFRF